MCSYLKQFCVTNANSQHTYNILNVYVTDICINIIEIRNFVKILKSENLHEKIQIEVIENVDFY